MYRRIISLFLCLLILCTSSSPVYAVEDKNSPTATSTESTEYILPEDFTFICDVAELPTTYARSSNDSMPYAALRIEFAGATYNELILTNQDIVVGTNDTATLTIERCVWAPESNDLYVGFWNAQTNVAYFRTLTDGDFSGTFTFTTLPAGIYRVYIRNKGASTLTTGYMRYTVS